jgi:tetratricopeptide (TPR) repeat protein
MLATIYLSTGKQQQALDSLNSVVSQTNDIPALMQLAGIHEQLKSYDKARQAYEKVLTAEPSFVPALNNLAFLYAERLGKLEQAYALSEKARKLQPSNPAISDTLGWILYRRGEYSRALALLQESATRLLTQPEIQFHLGMAHYMLGEEDSARLALERAVAAPDDFPEKSEARNCLAVLAFDVKTAGAAAVADLEKRLQQTPNDPVALLRLAALHERNGAAEKAIGIYETVLKQNPQNLSAMLHLARLYSQQTDGQARAMELAKAAHNLAPDDAAAAHILGRLVYRSGDFKWAASLLETSARNNSSSPEVNYDLAWSYYSLGRVFDAQRTMRQAADAGLSSAEGDDAKLFLSMVTGSTNQDDVLAGEAEKVLTSNPTYVPALMVSAAAQERRQNYNGAVQLYEKSVARFPLFTPALRSLALIYVGHLGDDQKAFERATKAREVLREDPLLAKALGMLYYRRGDYARSSQLLEESQRSLNDDAETMYYLGMAQLQLKRKVQGKENLQRALALNLGPKLAGEAQRQLKEIK